MAGHPELDVALEHLNRAEIRVVEQGRRLQYYILLIGYHENWPFTSHSILLKINLSALASPSQNR